MQVNKYIIYKQGSVVEKGVTVLDSFERQWLFAPVGLDSGRRAPVLCISGVVAMLVV